VLVVGDLLTSRLTREASFTGRLLSQLFIVHVQQMFVDSAV